MAKKTASITNCSLVEVFKETIMRAYLTKHLGAQTKGPTNIVFGVPHEGCCSIQYHHVQFKMEQVRSRKIISNKLHNSKRQYRTNIAPTIEA